MRMQPSSQQPTPRVRERSCSFSARLRGAITVTVGGQPAKVEGYLIYPGVYQRNVTIPDLPSGDAIVEIKMGSNSTQAGLSLPIGK